MKRICLLLLSSACTLFCNAQYQASPKSSGEKANAGKPKIINPEGKSPWPYSHSIYRGLQDKAGNLWFASSEGIYRYDGRLFTNYTAIGGISILPTYLPGMVEDVAEDKAGNIWFGAQGGAVRYDGKTFASLEMPPGDASNFFKSVKPWNEIDRYSGDEKPYVNVFPDKSGNVWFCPGFDLLRYDEQSNLIVQTGLGHYLNSQVFPYDSIRKDATINGFYQDKKGNLWFSVWGCSTRLHETYRLDGSRINHPCVLNKCTHDLNNPQDLAAHNKEIAASLTRITKQDGINSIAYLSVSDDKYGNVWFGTYDSGVYRYDGGSLEHFSDKDGLGTSAVGVIYEDKTGSIWFGTGNRNLDQGNGVFRYNGKSLTHFTTKDGLCNTGVYRNNFISSITEDNTGKLWFGGYGGVCRYNGKEFTNFTKKDGFNEQPVNCIVKDKAGNMWIGAWELGLYRYDGRSLTGFTEYKPGL